VRGDKRDLLGLVFFLSLSSCNIVKEKIGDYYFNKAKKIASKEEVSEKEIDNFYRYLIKALDYKDDLKGSIELVDNVTTQSLRAGYIKAYEEQLRFLKKYIEKNPYQWDAYIDIINIYSIKGDIYNLYRLDEDVKKRVIDDKNFKALSFIIETNILYWSAAYGELSLNSSYDDVYGWLSKYCEYARDIMEVKSLNDNKFFDSINSSLKYYFDSILSDLTQKENEIKYNCQIYNRIKNSEDFQKIIKYTISGNSHLSKKEYSNAIIYYKAALTVDENFVYTKKALIEAEFQNHLSLSLMKRDKTELENFIYEKFSEIDDIISSYNNLFFPFVSYDKFISRLYSLKAGMIKVILESSIDERKKEKLKENLKKCITLALKYDPKNQLAKDLMEKEQ
jgi:hypothetical protein